MKTIGLIGGMSWESSAEYYRVINQDMKARLGGHRNARSVMVTVCFETIERLQHERPLGRARCADGRAPRSQLQAGGADFVVLCTNTMHRVAGAIEAAVDIPFLHIVDPTARALQRAGVTRVGLLGTRFTMEHAFYAGRLKERFAIETVVPDAADRAIVHDIIYDELCHGTVREASRAEYLRIISRVCRRAASSGALILAAREIGMLVRRARTSRCRCSDTAGACIAGFCRRPGAGLTRHPLLQRVRGRLAAPGVSRSRGRSRAGRARVELAAIAERGLGSMPKGARITRPVPASTAVPPPRCAGVRAQVARASNIDAAGARVVGLHRRRGRRLAGFGRELAQCFGLPHGQRRPGGLLSASRKTTPEVARRSNRRTRSCS